MSDHLSDADLRQFVTHTLPAARVLAVGDHLDACAPCRDRAARLGFASREVLELHAALVSDPHLTEEQVIQYVAGELGDSEREVAARHLAACDVCAGEVDELRALEGRRRTPRWWYWAAAAVVALVLVPVVVSRWTPDEDQPARASLPGLALLPASYAEDVRRALEVGVADPPSWVSESSRVETLMGRPSSGAPFELIAPVGTATLTDRPAFRWIPLDGASAYTVEVFDEVLTPVASQAGVAGTEWTPPTAFARGRTYAWQVTAHRRGESVTMPVPPEPMATFRVLEQQTADAIETVMRAEPGSHVLLGILLAQAGAVEEARAHLERVPAADPHAELARRTLERLPRTR